jgi:hypothetical protein
MWTYRQSTGELSRDGAAAGVGYSGHGPGLNNPALERDPGVGPIPAGAWRIGVAFDHPRLGPCVMALTPVGWDAYGRSGFFTHGDNAALDESGSHGCIVLAKPLRLLIAGSGDRDLTVIP